MSPDPVAILIPAERPQNFARLVENIAEATPEPHHVYWMVHKPQCADELARLRQTYWTDNGASWGVRLNRLYQLTTEPFMFLGADDVKFHPGWLTEAMNAMQSVDGVVFVNDLYNPCGTLALVSRHYIDTMSGCADEPGVIIHPGYIHGYSDTELANTARHRGRYAKCDTSVVEHLHPGAGKAPHDEVYAKGAAAMGVDLQLHLSRAHLWGG